MTQNRSGRTPQRLRAHYEVERRLADQLRSASSEERRSLYSRVYDELFRSVPDHPQLTRKQDPRDQDRQTDFQLLLLDRFLQPDTVFLEIGAGDCSLSFRVAARVKKVCGIDVSPEIATGSEAPANFELVISDGTSIPVPAASATLAYSNQLMEHLHPDDALQQLRCIFTALAPGGQYVCVTPNRLSGPHDISKFFDDRATGFHLKEYTVTELSALMRRAGFSKTTAYAVVKNRYLPLRPAVVACVEWTLAKLPTAARRALAARSPLHGILGAVVVARKPA